MHSSSVALRNPLTERSSFLIVFIISLCICWVWAMIFFIWWRLLLGLRMRERQFLPFRSMRLGKWGCRLMKSPPPRYSMSLPANSSCWISSLLAIRSSSPTQLMQLHRTLSSYSCKNCSIPFSDPSWQCVSDKIFACRQRGSKASMRSSSSVKLRESLRREGLKCACPLRRQFESITKLQYQDCRCGGWGGVWGVYSLVLQSMNREGFLSLCDPHNSIIHEFGCEGSCTRPAAICLRGCNQYQHQQKANRHEFLNARELYTVVGSIRERYSAFKANFREVYLRRYLEEVAACVSSFEGYIFGDFLEKNPMIDIFCKYSSGGQAFQQLVEEQLEEVEFAEVRCRDVFQLRHFEQALQREGHEEQERRMMRLFSKIFEHHLRSNKIILTQKAPQERRLRQQDMIEAARLDSLSDALQRRITNLEYAQRQEKVEELLLILRTDLDDYEKNAHNADSLGKLFGSLQNYMEKTLPERIVLAVNFPVTVNPFWQKLAGFIGNKGLKQVSVWTTADALPAREMEGELSRRHEGAVAVAIHHNASWEDVSALIDKKPRSLPEG